MDVIEFEILVKKGLGRAVLLLRAEPDKSPFYGVVLHEATEHMGYDRQSEGDRAFYARELLRAAGDPPELFREIIDHADAVNAETYLFDFYHYIALLCVLYSDEIDGAGAALEHIYAHFRDALIARQKNPDTMIDNELELYTVIAKQYALLKGAGRLSVIFKDIAALLDKPELFNIRDFEETLSAFIRIEQKFKQDELNVGVDAERVWAAYNAQLEEYKRQRETRQATGPKNAAELLDFAMSGGKIGIPHIHLMQDATPELRLSLARLAFDEPDIEKKCALLRLFTKPFSPWPLDPLPLIDYLHMHENDLMPDHDYNDPTYWLAFIYIRVLSCVKAESVRSFALELARGESRDDSCRDNATELWIRNYRPEDAAAISEFVMSFHPEPNPDVCGSWHSVQMETLKLFDEKTPGAPDGLLRYIYESSFCACCRHRAVYHMSEKELYDDALLEEWALDSYRPTRDIALQTAAKRDGQILVYLEYQRGNTVLIGSKCSRHELADQLDRVLKESDFDGAADAFCRLFGYRRTEQGTDPRPDYRVDLDTASVFKMLNEDEPLFRLTASDFHWVSGKADDPDDLCLHGRAEALIGGERIVFDDTNLTAASLMLLRTLREDHTVVDGDNQLFPHCGHVVFADPDNPGRAVIICCPSGGDFSVRHDPDNPDFMVITTHKYCDTFVDRNEYKRQVHEFAASVREYYTICIPKNEPNDEAQRQGWAAFKQEWNDLYNN